MTTVHVQQICDAVADRAASAMGRQWTVLAAEASTPADRVAYITAVEASLGNEGMRYSQAATWLMSMEAYLQRGGDAAGMSRIVNELIGLQDLDAGTNCSLIAAVGTDPVTITDEHGATVGTAVIVPLRTFRRPPVDDKGRHFVIVICEFTASTS